MSHRIVVKNSAAMLIGQLLGKTAQLATFMIIARYLDDAPFGRLTFAVVLGQIYFFIADMGVSMISNKKISVDPSRKQEIFSSALGLRIIMIVVGYAVMLTAVLLAGYSQEQIGYIAIISISAAMLTLAEVSYLVFRATERMTFEGVARAASGILGLVLIVAVVRMDLGVGTVLVTFVARTFLALFIGFSFLHRTGISIKPSFDLTGKLLPLFKQSVPLGITGLLFITYQKFDNVIIKAFLGDEAVGAYQQCYRLLETFILLVAPTLLPGALFPSLCRAAEKSWKAAGEKMTAMTEVFLSAAAIITLPFFAGGLDTLRLLWGPSFLREQDPSKLILTYYLVLAAVPIVYVMHVMLAAIIAKGRQKISVWITAVAVTVSLLGNIILLPRFGLPAAGAMVILSTLAIAVLYYRDLTVTFGHLPILNAFIRPVASLVLSAPLLFFMSDNHVIAKVILLPVVYSVWWIILGGGKAVKLVISHPDDTSGIS